MKNSIKLAILVISFSALTSCGFFSNDDPQTSIESTNVEPMETTSTDTATTVTETTSADSVSTDTSGSKK